MSKVYFHTDSNHDVYFSIGLLSQDFVAWRHNVLESKYTEMAGELFSWLSVNSPHEISTHDLVVNSSNNNFIALLNYMNNRKQLEVNHVKAEPMIELTISLYSDMLYIRDLEQTTTAEIDKDTKQSRVFELLQQLSKINRFKIPANRIDFIRHYPISYSTIQFLLECHQKANERTGLVGYKPVIETLSLLHFVMQRNNLIIREQIDNDWARARNVSINNSNRAVAQWCEDNSPLYLKNTDAINLMNYQEWSDDYCLSFLADVKKDYKKPMPKQNDETGSIEPKPRYQMTFEYGGSKRTFIRNDPCYFVRYDAEKESYDSIIGTPYEPLQLPTNGDRYIILSPCTVEEIKLLWTIHKNHHDYQLRYENNCMMDFRADSPFVNLVNWFLETQPKLTDQQCDIMFDCSDSLHVLSLFQAMYK